MSKHPIQPLEMIDGVKRFKQNKILGYLFDQGCIDMNKLAMIDFPQDDRQQFAQLSIESRTKSANTAATRSRWRVSAGANAAAYKFKR